MPIQSDPDVLVLHRGAQPTRRVVRWSQGGEVTIERSTLIARVPFPAVDRLYWTVDGDRLVVAGDARLVHRRSMSVDPVGLLSLVLMGSVVPPWALFREQRSVRPGFETTIDLETFRASDRATADWPAMLDADATMPTDEQARLLAEALDRQLAEVARQGPVLLFSGGVDSGVLAYRLSRLGHRDTTLLHYSFREDSPDTVAAQALARELGLAFESVTPGDVTATDILDRAADLYRHPFCDHSAVPTHQLGCAAVGRFDRSRPILDGTGADGAFGLFGKARTYARLASLPHPIRRGASGVFRWRRMWRTSSRVEHAVRILHRLGTMSPLAASIAQHAMLGIGLRPPASQTDTVFAALDSWIGPIAPPDDPHARMPLADIGLICAGIFAQKDYSIFADAGHRIEYPFLAPSMVTFALRRAGRWPNSEAPKHALKSLLLQIAPPEVIHRPKTGFVSDTFDLFERPEMIARVVDVIEDDHPRTAPLRALLDASVLRTLADDLRARRGMPAPTYNFLWSIAFASSWLRSIDDAADRARERLLAARGESLEPHVAAWLRASSAPQASATAAP